MAKKKSVPLPPAPEIRDAAISMIRKTPEPVTAKQICGLLAVLFKITEPVLLPVLDESVANGLLQAIPAGTARGKPRYWDRDLIEFGRLQIEATIRKKGPQPIASLKTAAKGLAAAQFQSAFQSLIDERRVCVHPPVGKSKTLKYGVEPPAPEPYFKDVGKQLSKVVEQLISAGVDRNSLFSVISVWLAQAGLTLPSNDVSPGPSISCGNADLELLMLMRQIEPGAERGALVTARELRRAANSDKLHFDQTVLSLARQGRLMLHRHDHASGLSSSERDELVTDGAGTYYVGMALRRVEG